MGAGKKRTGFRVGFGAAILLVFALVGWGSYYYLRQNRVEFTQETPAAQEELTTDEFGIPLVESYYIDEDNEYSLLLINNRMPNLSHTSPSNLWLRNSDGGVLTYDQASSRFVTAESVGAPKKPLEPVTKAGDKDVYLWENGSQRFRTSTYLLVMDDGRILEAEFEYVLQSESGEGEGLTEEEFDLQKRLDQRIVESYSYLY